MIGGKHTPTRVRIERTERASRQPRSHCRRTAGPAECRFRQTLCWWMERDKIDDVLLWLERGRMVRREIYDQIKDRKSMNRSTKSEEEGGREEERNTEEMREEREGVLHQTATMSPSRAPKHTSPCRFLSPLNYKWLREHPDSIRTYFCAHRNVMGAEGWIYLFGHRLGRFSCTGVT
jgi:hypothetical protein